MSRASRTEYQREYRKRRAEIDPDFRKSEKKYRQNINEKLKERYRNDPEYRQRKLDIQRKARRKKARWFEDYKANLSCERCGFNHPAALDFHHVDPSEKEDGVVRMVYAGASRDTIMEEISKCIVLCANCHRMEHWDADGRV